MNKTKDFFSELAAQGARWRATAKEALASYSCFRTLSIDTLESYFVALCRADDGKYDRKLRVRRRIIRLLPDIRLINLLDIGRMPCQLTRMISIRLCPRDDKGWGPSIAYFDDFIND
jgi:hypothetical protein